MTTTYGTGIPIESELGGQHANGEKFKFKIEPDSPRASPGAQADEDLYEDAGDLDFSGAIQNIYLTRIPRYLWDDWSKLDNDQEIQIGTVRMEGTGGDIKRVRLDLSLMHEQLLHDFHTLLILTSIDEPHVIPRRHEERNYSKRIQYECLEP